MTRLLIFFCLTVISAYWTTSRSRSSSLILSENVVNSTALIETNNASVVNKTALTDLGLSTAAKPSAKAMCIVTFVNGIYHSIEDWREIVDYIEQTFGAEVRPFYNPSSGWWVTDATHAGFALVRRPNDLGVAKELSDHLRSCLTDLEPKGRVLHIAHSGGAIVTYLAAKHHLTSQETSRIDVVTLGGGKSLTRKYFKGSRIYNYYARNDPLTVIDSRASRLIRLTRNATYQEVRDAKHNTSFVFLAAQANNPITDHAVLGPTYKLALELEAGAYKLRLQEMMKLQAREKDILRWMRKRAAKLSGVHHFWDWYVYEGSSQALRRARKFAASVTNMHGYFSGKTPEPYDVEVGKTIDELEFSDSR